MRNTGSGNPEVETLLLPKTSPNFICHLSTASLTPVNPPGSQEAAALLIHLAKANKAVVDTTPHFNHPFLLGHPQEAAALLNHLTKANKAVLGEDDPMSIDALFPAVTSSGSSSSGLLMIGKALAAALASSSTCSKTEAATPTAAEGVIVTPLRAAAEVLNQLLVRGTHSSTKLAAPRQGSVTGATAATAAEPFPSGLSLMELLHEALGSSSGNASLARHGGGGGEEGGGGGSSSGNAVARPGGGGLKTLGAPRAGVIGVVSSGFAAGASAGVRSGDISRAGSGLLVGDERFMGSRAERWQAALLTSANASRMSRDAEAAVESRKSRDAEKKMEKKMKKGNASRSGGNSKVQSAGHAMLAAADGGLPQHPDEEEEEPDCVVEGWEDGAVVHPGLGDSLHSRAPKIPNNSVDGAGGIMTAGGSTLVGGSSMTAGGWAAAAGGSGGGSTVGMAGGGTGSTAASSKAPELPLQAAGASTTAHLASNAIAVLAAKAQAAHLVALLANNQQLLSGSWAQQDASVHSSNTTGSGGQRPSDNLSRMSDAPSSTTRRPSGSQRDNASRRLSALLIEMRTEAEGGGSDGDAVRRRRRLSDVLLAVAGGSVMRPMGPPPTPDELAAAAVSLDVEVSGSGGAVCPKAPRWKNIFKVERRPFRPFCQPDIGGPPFGRVSAAPDDNLDAQSIAEEASD